MLKTIIAAIFAAAIVTPAQACDVCPHPFTEGWRPIAKDFVVDSTQLKYCLNNNDMYFKVFLTEDTPANRELFCKGWQLDEWYRLGYERRHAKSN